MQLIIAAVGHKMPTWIESGFTEYTKRMPPELRIVLKEIKPVERSGSKTAATAMALERERIEAVLPKGVRIIALDERGRDLTSVGLSDVLPIDEHARSLVMIEQVAGVLYVALVIARLVGLTVARAANRADQD